MGSGLGAGSHSREHEPILSEFAWDTGECMGEGCREVPIRDLGSMDQKHGLGYFG